MVCSLWVNPRHGRGPRDPVTVLVNHGTDYLSLMSILSFSCTQKSIPHIMITLVFLSTLLTKTCSQDFTAKNKSITARFVTNNDIVVIDLCYNYMVKKVVKAFYLFAVGYWFFKLICCISCMLIFYIYPCKGRS